eukprot:jgi/Bigna1/45947/estExt_Genewise1.C_10174
MSFTSVVGSSFGGLSLNSGQRLAVKAALLKLSLQEKLENIVFWGKIMGTEKDYLIAKNLNAGKMEFSKTFYVSVDDGVKFSNLLPISEEKAALASAIKFEMFTGNPQNRYGDAPEEEEPEEGEEKKPDARLSEEERLFYVVSKIDHETSIVPTGSYVCTPTSRVVKNPEFSGLSMEAAKKLVSYSMMRQPESKQIITKNKVRGASNTVGFLDPLNNKPTGTWCVKTDETGLMVTIRNYRWIGFEFHTLVGESWFESAYFGDGLANEDLALMV